MEKILKNRRFFYILTLICLVGFLILPNISLADDFKNITLKEIEKYLPIPEREVNALIHSLIDLFNSEWINRVSSAFATAEESAVANIMRNVARAQVLNHLLIDAPLQITWGIIKGAIEIVRIYFDPAVGLEKLEKLSVEKAIEEGKRQLFRSEVRATPGAIEFKYITQKGEIKEVIFQYVMIYQPTEANKGKMVIRFYSPSHLEIPKNQGNITGTTGFYTELTTNLPPFIVDTRGTVENYKWVGNPVIDINFPATVPDLGIRPLSFWERHIWKPIVAQFKEVEVIITKVTGKAPRIVETILNLPQTVNQVVRNTWNGIKSLISKFNPFGAGLGQQVVSPPIVENREVRPPQIREPVQEKKENPVVGKNPELRPRPISEKEKEEIKKRELQKRIADLLEQIDLVQAKIDRLTKEKEAQKIAKKAEKNPKELKKEKKKEEEKKLDENEDLAKKKKEKTKKDTVCGFRSININTASKEELQKITGVGPVIAQRIISARPFYSLNDLIKVKGIGAITLQKIITQGCAYVTGYAGGGGGETTVTYPKILISEIQISPIENRFIELYNPNDSQISLNNWYIQRKTATGTTWGSLITSTQFEGKIIQPKNYFLISRTLGNSDILLTDLTLTKNNSLVLKNPNREIVDKIGWGTAQEYETAPTSNPSTGQSIGRKWSTEDQNYLDTDNNSADFEIQTPTPKTQNQSTEPQPATPSLTVVINEIAWMGTKASANDEWIELYNPTKNPIDLTGWKLVSLTDNSPNITLTGTIPPLGFYLLERTNDDTVKDIPANWQGSFGSGGLKNDGEELELRDSQNNLVDKITCQKDEAGKCKSWLAGKNEKDENNEWIRISMERINPRVSGEDPSNWADNNPQIARNGLDAKGQPINGTPRAQNSVYKSLPPKPVKNFAIDYQKSSGNKVVLTWSPATDLDTLSEKLSYEIRYLKNEEIGENNWQKAIQIPKIPARDSESGKLTITISDLDYNSTYYFGIRAFDSQNYSPLSTISQPYRTATLSTIASNFSDRDLNPNYFKNNGRKIVRTSKGDLYVVYSRAGKIFLAKSEDKGRTWKTTLVSEKGLRDQINPSIAIDSQNNIHIVWQGKVDILTPYQIRYAKYDGNSFSAIENLTNSEWDQEIPVVVVDSQDNVHIVWVNKQQICINRRCVAAPQLLHGIFTDQQRIIEKIAEIYKGGFSSFALAIDSQDNLHLISRESRFWDTGSEGKIQYRKRISQGWIEITKLSSDDLQNDFPSLAIDNQNNLHIVWHSLENLGRSGYRSKINYLKYTNSTSSIEILNQKEGSNMMVIASPSIALDSQGRLYVIWKRWNEKISLKEYFDSWQDVKNLELGSLRSFAFTNLLWSFHPLNTNQPKTGFAFIFYEGTDLKFYASQDLTWHFNQLINL